MLRMSLPHGGFQLGYRSAVCYLFLWYGLMNSPLSAGKIASTEEGTNMMDGDFTDLDFDERLFGQEQPLLTQQRTQPIKTSQ